MADNDNVSDKDSKAQVEPLNVNAQLKSLEDVLLTWQKKREEYYRKAEHRFRHLMIQCAVAVTSSVGLLWTGVEMVSWYIDVLQRREMARKYSVVATEMYENENNPDVAQQMLENALALDDSFETRYRIAYIKGMKAVQLLLNLDRPFNKSELNTAHQSLADAKFLTQLRGDRPEGYILASQLYTALKEYDHAEETIKQALTLAPDNAFAQVRYVTLLFTMRRFDEARKVIEKTVAAFPDYKWARLWYGLVLDAQKQKKQAIEQFEYAIKLDPKFDTAIYNLGCSYLNCRPRNFAGARKCFQRVLQINPSYRQAYYQLGMSYGFEDRYDVALTYMNKAVDLDNDYLTVHNWRALVLFEMKRFEESVAAYSRAIMLDPRNDELYVRRAAARIEMKQYETAINDLNFALELNAKNLEALMSLSNLYLKTGNTDLAFAKIDTAIRGAAADDKSMLADLWNMRAKIWFQKGDLGAAVKDQTEAVKCFKSKFTMYRLALYQFRAKDPQAALKTLDELNKLDAKFAAAWNLRVQILKDSDRAAALAAVNRYLELKPQDKKMQALKKDLEKDPKGNGRQ